MTKLIPGKPLLRETAVFERADALVIVLHPRTIEVRLKGKRIGVHVPYDAVLDLGRKLQARSMAKGAGRWC